MEQLTFRYALEQDCGLILHFIRELASYEKMLDGVVVPGLEPPQHRILSVPGRAAHGRVDGVPLNRRDAANIGSGIGYVQILSAHSGLCACVIIAAERLL